MADCGFEKRDFRKVLHTRAARCFSGKPVVGSSRKATRLENLTLRQRVVLWRSNAELVMFGSALPGGVLHGPGLGRGIRLPPLQDPQGRVSGPAGALPRSPVCRQVWKSCLSTFPINRPDLIFNSRCVHTATSCEWTPQTQTRCTSEACVSTMKTASRKPYSSSSRLCAWPQTTKRPA